MEQKDGRKLGHQKSYIRPKAKKIITIMAIDRDRFSDSDHRYSSKGEQVKKAGRERHNAALCDM
jgi:hypothetical protein